MDGSPKCGSINPCSGQRSYHENNREQSPENNGVFHEANANQESLNENHCIPVHVSQSYAYSGLYQKQNKFLQRSQVKSNLINIRRSDKAVQALNLPKVININPRSINNKVESFKTYMMEEEVDLAFISESHERKAKPLVDRLKMEGFEIISNVHQRRGKGGRPALVVNQDKFDVLNVTNTLINIPWGV